MEDLAALHEAIRHLEGCWSSWVEALPVVETFEGQTVWDGEVHVFDLIDHSTAKRAYAWSAAVGDSERRRFVVVLHKPPVDSPRAAVQATVAADFRAERRGLD